MTQRLMESDEKVIPTGLEAEIGQEKSKATSGRSTLTQVIVVVVVLAIVAFFAYGLRFRGDPGPKIGQPASSFSLTTFDGRQIALNDLKGKVVVVNFWASWCKPACWDEAPDLERTWRKYKDRGVMFIGIDYVDTESEGLAFLKNFDITYPNGPDLGSKISQVYRVKGVPETVVIDKSGKIAAIGRGGISTAKYEGPIDASLLSATLDRLLAE